IHFMNASCVLKINHLEAKEPIHETGSRQNGMLALPPADRWPRTLTGTKTPTQRRRKITYLNMRQHPRLFR
ncbi:MAG: hypothetical protein OEN48_16030, partial [Betaproteobacteria bacterium]|nr:hypothetical protein [Betaproteobacteria bacterium]